LNLDGSKEVFTPGPSPNTVRSSHGSVIPIPPGWILLLPGDPALTRRVKAAGDHWVVQEKKGRKIFSKGIWAPSETIDRIRTELEAERSTETYAKRQQSNSLRREKVQTTYVERFLESILLFLDFPPSYANLAKRLAQAVSDHATPIGSGTVARTKRIPIDQRAEAAVIAWMRHQTTAYDSMTIPRIKGKRREIRRMLARRSQEILDRYRQGEVIPENCPLKQALKEDLPSLTPIIDSEQ
jgi:hypothetical protein